MFRGVLWEYGLIRMGRGCGSGLEGVVNWGSEVLGEGGKFLFRALLLRRDDESGAYRLGLIDGC